MAKKNKRANVKGKMRRVHAPKGMRVGSIKEIRGDTPLPKRKPTDNPH